MKHKREKEMKVDIHMTWGKNFINAVLDNEANIQDIDVWVARWRKDPSRSKPALHHHLGLTWDQYAHWVEKPDDLWIIFREIRQQRSQRATRRVS